MIPSKRTASKPIYYYHLDKSPSPVSSRYPVQERDGGASSPAVTLMRARRSHTLPPADAKISQGPSHFHLSFLLRHKPNMGIHRSLLPNPEGPVGIP